MVTREGRKRQKRSQPTDGVEVTLYLTVMRGMSALHLLPRLVALMMVTMAALQMSSLVDLMMASAS